MVSLAGIGGMIGGASAATVSIVVQGVDRFSNTFKRAALGLEGMRSAANAVGIASLAMAAGLGFAIKTSINFEQAFVGVRKTVELTEEGFADLENRFKTLSKEIPVSFIELSRIGELAGQLGVEGVDNLEKFVETIAAIAVTTNLTSEDASTSFARIANIMQEPIDNIDRMGSVVVELGNNFATTEREIVEFANRIAGAGKIAGLSTKDIFAIGTAFSSVGVQAEAGGTAVQKVLIKMKEAIVDSGEKLEAFARTAGLTTLEFSELFEKDAAIAFKLFVEGLGKDGDKAIKILDELGLKDQRLIRAFLSLAEAGDLLGRSLASSNDEWTRNNALVAEAEKFYGTSGAQVEILKNKFASLADEIGDILIPEVLVPLIDTLDNLINKWDNLSDEQKGL